MPADVNLRILAIMQNQWFKNPMAVKAIYARHPEKRNELIARFLFMGSLSGKRLLATLGGSLCNRIIWEEASPEIGDFSGSNFGADLGHLKNALEIHRPQIVVALGRIAGEAIRNFERYECPVRTFLYAPHPASRTNPFDELLRLRDEIIKTETEIFREASV